MNVITLLGAWFLLSVVVTLVLCRMFAAMNEIDGC